MSVDYLAEHEKIEKALKNNLIKKSNFHVETEQYKSKLISIFGIIITSNSEQIINTILNHSINLINYICETKNTKLLELLESFFERNKQNICNNSDFEAFINDLLNILLSKNLKDIKGRLLKLFIKLIKINDIINEHVINEILNNIKNKKNIKNNFNMFTSLYVNNSEFANNLIDIIVDNLNNTFIIENGFKLLYNKINNNKDIISNINVTLLTNNINNEMIDNKYKYFKYYSLLLKLLMKSNNEFEKIVIEYLGNMNLNNDPKELFKKIL